MHLHQIHPLIHYRFRFVQWKLKSLFDDDDEIYWWTTVAWEIITLQRFLIKQILWYCNIQEVAKNDVVLPPHKACQSNRIWMTITFFLICFSSFLLCFIQIQMTGGIIIGQIKQCRILYFLKWLNLEPKLHIKNIVCFWIWLSKFQII